MPNGFGIKRDPPSGTIVMWGGALADIPTGWVLCDGNNGTPDLRSRFIRGTAAGKDPGTTGGENFKTLTVGQLPSHSHKTATTTATDGEHQHGVSASLGAASGSDYIGYRLNSSQETSDSHESITDTNSQHSHTFEMHGTGSGEAYDNQPEHVELAFIMKT